MSSWVSTTLAMSRDSHEHGEWTLPGDVTERGRGNPGDVTGFPLVIRHARSGIQRTKLGIQPHSTIMTLMMFNREAIQRFLVGGLLRNSPNA